MKRAAQTLFVLASLAACGADGPPQPPAATQAATPKPAVAITGTARMGVVAKI